MKKVDINTRKLVIDYYVRGKSMKLIGELCGISITTVLNILKDNNIERRTKGGIYKINENDVVNRYKSGQSSQEIANVYKVTCHTITNILERQNIKRNNIYHNLDLIEDYWECIDSYDKAYFLGFMLSDGNVCGNQIKLQLSAKDIQILYTFAEKTKNSNTIKEDKKGLASFSVKRRKWVEDLNLYGVIPNKTYTVKLPNNINSTLTSHLIRGLIDGDGWISSRSHQVGICGTEELVTQVRDIFVKELSVYNVKVLHTEEHLWQATWASISDIKKIGEYLYKDKADCYLERKYKEYLKIINTEVN